MTQHAIQLHRYEPVNVNFHYFSAYRMRVEVADIVGDGFDQHIFIYQKRPVSPYSGLGCDTFCAIAGPSQFSTIPAVEADPQKSYPYYRLNYVELDFISRKEALQAWEVIQKEVAILVEAMGKLAQLAIVESPWFPAAPADDSTTSESVSESV